MSVGEGLGYAATTLLLVSTVGNTIAFRIFGLFQMQADYAILTYPFVLALVASMAVLAVCVITPESAYRSLHRSTLAMRLREPAVGRLASEQRLTGTLCCRVPDAQDPFVLELHSRRSARPLEVLCGDPELHNPIRTDDLHLMFAAAAQVPQIAFAPHM